MKKTNYLALDGNSLLVLITVLEELSVTRAADRLGVTQSAVSHTLDKLRTLLGDPLFVRSGRNIAATELALELLTPAREVLDGLKGLTDKRQFDPTGSELKFTIAVNDFLRSAIFPALIKQLTKQSINTRFVFLTSGIPDASLLRKRYCDLIITPFPPDGIDVFQVQLFTDTLKCFYDASIREAPISKQDILQASHVDVLFEGQYSVMQHILNSLNIDVQLKSKISVPNFDAISEFILGTDMISVQLGRMKKGSLQKLDCVDLPFKTRKLGVYMTWHRRDNFDPAHKWLREHVASCAN